MAFLDFSILALGFYLVTQIFLPLVLPRYFVINWLFKKSKPKDQNSEENTVEPDDLKGKINTLSHKKASFKQEVKEVTKKTAEEARKANDLDAAARKLNN